MYSSGKVSRCGIYEENEMQEEKKMTKEELRMKEIVERFTEYVTTYTNCKDYLKYSDECFVKDMMYGIGYSLNPGKYRFAQGFRRFMRTSYESWIKKDLGAEKSFKTTVSINDDKPVGIILESTKDD